jgi:hypothetical protein
LYEYKIRHELPSSTCIIQRDIQGIPLNDDVIIIIFALFWVTQHNPLLF